MPTVTSQRRLPVSLLLLLLLLLWQVGGAAATEAEEEEDKAKVVLVLFGCCTEKHVTSRALLAESATTAGIDVIYEFDLEGFRKLPFVRKHAQELARLGKANPVHKRWVRPYSAAFKPILLEHVMNITAMDMAAGKLGTSANSKRDVFVMWADSSRHYVHGFHQPLQPLLSALQQDEAAPPSFFGAVECEVRNDLSDCIHTDTYNAMGIYDEAERRRIGQLPHVLTTNLLLRVDTLSRVLLRDWVHIALANPNAFAGSHTEDQAIWNILLDRYARDPRFASTAAHTTKTTTQAKTMHACRAPRYQVPRKPLKSINFILQVASNRQHPFQWLSPQETASLWNRFARPLAAQQREQGGRRRRRRLPPIGAPAV